MFLEKRETNSSRRRLFEISTRRVEERERERVVEPLRELTCIGINLCSEGIYVRAKQVPGIEAPQYDNAITPLLSWRFSRLLLSPFYLLLLLLLLLQFSTFSLTESRLPLFTEDFAIVPVPIVTLLPTH